MQLPLVKGDKVRPGVDYGDALPINAISVPHPVKGAVGYMTDWYGITEFADGYGMDRGGKWVSADGFSGHYRVSGTTFIKVHANGSITHLGDVGAGGQCSIAYSFNNIAIVSAKNLYYYNPEQGLRKISDPQVGSPIDIEWADGIFFLTDGIDLYHSDPANEESFLPADYGNAQFSPDFTNGLGLNEDNEIIAFGAKTTEYFTNQGAADFQYLRIQLKAIKVGILGTHCRKEMGSRWYVISRRDESSPSISVIQGGGVEVIATREIEKILYSYTQKELSESTIDAMVRDGLKLIQFNLKRHTLIFNETSAEALGVSQAWSIIKSGVLYDSPFNGINYVLDSDASKWICGDRATSKIGVVDELVSTNYGEISESILFTPMVKLDSLTVDYVEIETIPGFAPDNDATIFISSSQNGVFTSSEYTLNYGDNLDYSHRLIAYLGDYVENFISYRIRSASKSRMCFSMFVVSAS